MKSEVSLISWNCDSRNKQRPIQRTSNYSSRCRTSLHNLNIRITKINMLWPHSWWWLQCKRLWWVLSIFVNKVGAFDVASLLDIVWLLLQYNLFDDIRSLYSFISRCRNGRIFHCPAPRLVTFQFYFNNPRNDANNAWKRGIPHTSFYILYWVMCLTVAIA